MPLRLDAALADFPERFRAYVERRREEEADVRDQVRAILDAVRTEGDAALVAFTERFDGVRLDPRGLRVEAGELEDARRRTAPQVCAALERAAERIRDFHERQLPGEERFTDALGVKLGWRWTPIETVGLYVPGGRAAYPSSVLMNAIPARVAGCRRLVMAVPAPEGELDPRVLVAAEIAGVDEIYRIGGAQAIAALAYGTATVPRVDKIVGPGNAYVAEAKRQLFGRVGIDLIAGPSELVVIADRHQNPRWVAADLLSQAEHDERAQTVVIADDPALLDAVAAEVERQLRTLPREAIARASWEREGALIRARSLEEAVELANALAPEHLQLMTQEAEQLLSGVRHAGAVFLGPLSAEVIGDYVGGPNHVLPTSRTARFASGLGVWDFLKRTTVLSVGQEGFWRLGPDAVTLARAEGLEAHARAVEMRLEERA